MAAEGVHVARTSGDAFLTSGPGCPRLHSCRNGFPRGGESEDEAGRGMHLKLYTLAPRLPR